MPNYRQQRKERNRQRFSAMGKASQKAQAGRRLEHMAQRIRERAEWDVWNLPRKQGDALGCLQWTDFRSAKVRRWVVRIGDRMDRMTVHSPDGRCTESHGWTWILVHLRGYLAGTKS